MLRFHLVALALFTTLAVPACLRSIDPPSGAVQEGDLPSDTALDVLGAVDGGEDDVTELHDCRRFATQWGSPNRGTTASCAFDAAALTFACTQAHNETVEHYPSLPAFIAGKVIGLTTATTMVRTMVTTGQSWTTEYTYLDDGRLVGAVTQETGGGTAVTKATAWDEQGRWTVSTVTDAEDCTDTWSRVIDDATRTEVVSRIDSACSFDAVVRTLYDEGGIAVFRESGGSFEELSGGELVIGEVDEVCVP